MDDLLGAFGGRQLALEGVGNGPLPRNVDVSVNKGGDRFAIEIVDESNFNKAFKQSKQTTSSLDDEVLTNDTEILQQILDSTPNVNSLEEAKLLNDAREIVSKFGVGKAVNTKTVAVGVFIDPDTQQPLKLYAVSSNKTLKPVREKAEQLGYKRVSGKEFTDINQTDAEQILLNYAERKNLLRDDFDAPIAPSRPACGSSRQNCAGRIDSTPGVRLIGPRKEDPSKLLSDRLF